MLEEKIAYNQTKYLPLLFEAMKPEKRMTNCVYKHQNSQQKKVYTNLNIKSKSLCPARTKLEISPRMFKNIYIYINSHSSKAHSTRGRATKESTVRSNSITLIQIFNIVTQKSRIPNP